jgi:hypothetical protein
MMYLKNRATDRPKKLSNKETSTNLKDPFWESLAPQVVKKEFRIVQHCYTKKRIQVDCCGGGGTICFWGTFEYFGLRGRKEEEDKKISK